MGDLELRPREHVAFVADKEIALTPGEFEIVLALAEHPGWVFSASQLANDSEEGEEHSPESVSVLVSRVRQKLATAGLSDAIETVRGFGYRLRRGAEPTDAVSVMAARSLRDAAWQLQEAVIEVEHSGTAEQQEAAAEVLQRARHAVFASLAE